MSIQKMYMEVELSIGTVTGTKKGVPETKQLNKDKNAISNAAKVYINTFGNNPKIKAVNDHAACVRKIYANNTLAWGISNGRRVAPIGHVINFLRPFFEEEEKKHKALVKEVIDNYSAIVVIAAKENGDLHDSRRILSVEEMESRYRFQYHVSSLADPNNSIVQASDAQSDQAVEDMKKDYEKEYRIRVEKVEQENMARIEKSLTTLIKQCSENTRFSSTLLTNPIEVIATARGLDASGGLKVENVSRAVESLCKNRNLDDIKNFETSREEIIVGTKEILADYF